MGLDEDTALRALGGGRYEGTVVETWWTPRGPLGGYVMAIVLRALEAEVGDSGRQARSFTMHFLRPPAAGPVAVTATVERAGRSLTSATARLEQEGRLLGLALAAFSTPWPGSLPSEAPMPEVDPVEPAAPHARDLPGTKRPPFAERLLMQGRFGAAPFSGADRGEVGGWLGLREERPVDSLAVALLADAWFPAPWPRLTAFAAAPTVDMTVHFRARLPLPASASPLLGRFRCRHVEDGFFEEDGELWAPDGRLVAQSRQLGLLIEPREPASGPGSA